jgi:pyruvate formate lyase activating enzyme
MMDRPRTPPTTVSNARRIALEAGLRHVYTGNVHDPEGQSTRCTGCGEVVIGRDWNEVSTYRLRSGGLCRCGTRLAGRFDGAGAGARPLPS